MRFRSLLVVIASGLAALFVVLNWQVFAGPATVNLLLTSAQVPIGVLMLMLFGLALLVLWIIVGGWQGTLLAEFRRQGLFDRVKLLAETLARRPAGHSRWPWRSASPCR